MSKPEHVIKRKEVHTHFLLSFSVTLVPSRGPDALHRHPKACKERKKKKRLQVRPPHPVSGRSQRLNSSACVVRKLLCSTTWHLYTDLPSNSAMIQKQKETELP